MENMLEKSYSQFPHHSLLYTILYKKSQMNQIKLNKIRQHFQVTNYPTKLCSSI